MAVRELTLCSPQTRNLFLFDDKFIEHFIRFNRNVLILPFSYLEKNINV